ncbi:MAG: ABC transporter permease, partial [Terracidiphilus sp.]
MREQFVTFWKDLQRAARTWTRSPGNFLATAGSMALAIGANTVIFSALDAVLLRSFPGKDPTRLMMLSPQFSFSYQDYQSIRRNAGAFQDVTCSYPVTVSLSSEERAERVTGELVAANYFEVLGIMPQMGRRFMSDEDLPGSPRNVVILSDNLWKRMGRDSNIIGKAISIGGRQFTVVGVAPPLFNGTLQGVSSEIFAPLPTYAAAVPSFAESNLLSDPEQRGFDVFGRLRLDMTRNEADARLVTTLNWVEERKPRAKRRIVSLHSMTEIPGADGRRLVVWTKVLFVAVTLLLILACINTTGTLLARSLKRDREFATRIALGANRAQLLKLMLAEGLTLCVVASGIGLVIALILAPFLSRLSLPVDLPLQTAFHIALRVDQPVFVYTCGVCVSSTLVFALVLALSVPLSDVNVRLRTPLQSVGLGRYVLSRNMLLIAQIAIATSLLIVAGLFVRSLSRAASTDIGFSRDHSLLLRIDPRAAGRDVPATLRLLERTRSDISSIPGVERAAYTTLMPLGGFASASGFAPSDKSSDMSIQADVFATNSDFVQALRIPLLEG